MLLCSLRHRSIKTLASSSVSKNSLFESPFLSFDSL